MTDVSIVHCIDTEGPLAEAPLSLEDGLEDNVFPRPLPPGGFDGDIKGLIDWHRKGTLGSWERITAMLRRATSPEQRRRFPDSFGTPWRFNWFCMDHLDFIENPRRRAMGIHAVYDFYSDLVLRQKLGDAVHWHFHPMSTYRQANQCATSYTNSPALYEILCRRVIDRKFFPRANRAGFQDERPDSHWFLEQWIPFDLSNMASDDICSKTNPDFEDGRFSDWRWAPKDWRTYRPAHNCHQLEGQCQRKIARCLPVLTRVANLSAHDVEAAFARAAQGLPTLLSFSSHDWRDLCVEMDYVAHLIEKAQARHPGVKFRYCEAVEAFNAVHPAPVGPALRLGCRLLKDEKGRPLRINIETLSGKIFGSQPFLAIRTRSRRYIHDNLNYWNSLDSFNYVFDEQSVLPEDVSAIGVVANDALGNQCLHTIEIDDQTPGCGAIDF
ncbi:MAG: hypothetical protein HQL43_00075 [Alphaproteobacteria bacterium]|nr:hypothetical protein [Alphaproteobacteria bacterium]